VLDSAFSPASNLSTRTPGLYLCHRSHQPERLFHFLMRRVLPARIAKLLRLQPVRMLLLVFRRCVVAVLAIPALQRNCFPHAFVSLPSSLLTATR
jgi:hypothetical protein